MLRGVRLSHGTAQRSRPLHLLFGTANTPHPDKKGKGGEDAFFADPAIGAFGVADGVGGSARQGVDPGIFSRMMLSLCHRHLVENAVEPPSAAHLTRAMEASGHALERNPQLLRSNVRLLARRHILGRACRVVAFVEVVETVQNCCRATHDVLPFAGFGVNDDLAIILDFELQTEGFRSALEPPGCEGKLADDLLHARGRARPVRRTDGRCRH